MILLIEAIINADLSVVLNEENLKKSSYSKKMIF